MNDSRSAPPSVNDTQSVPAWECETARGPGSPAASRRLRTVRPATLGDAALIANLQIRAWRESFQNLLSAQTLEGLDREELTQSWEKSLSDPDLTTHLGELDGSIVGFALAGPAGAGSPRELELKMLYILESAKGTGLGQMLFDTSIGSQPAMLWVAETNDRALAFYARNGFEPDGILKTLPRWDNIVNLRVVR